MVFADDLVLLGKNEVQGMYSDLCAAIRPWKLRIKGVKLVLWSNYGGPSILIGDRRMAPEAYMVFLGVMLAHDRMAVAKHRAETAWAKLWSIKKHLTAKLIPAKAHLLRLKAEAGPVLLWGCASMHLRRDTLVLVDGTFYRMARIALHLFRPEVRVGWTDIGALGARPGPPSKPFGIANPPQKLRRARPAAHRGTPLDSLARWSAAS